MPVAATDQELGFDDRVEFDQAVDRVRAAAAAYFAGEPLVMSDGDYDLLVARIAATVQRHDDWDHRGVLTKVAAGAVPRGEVVHTTPMLSLDKATTIDEVAAFLATLADSAAVVEVKLDGVAVRAQYRDGRLVRAATRGDGHSGEDVTAQVRRHGGVYGLPAVLSRPWTGEVRGEIYMTTADFEQANAVRVAHGKPAFANPRNAVAGVLRKQDLRYPVPMSFAAYAIVGDGLDTVAGHLERMAEARALGLTTATALTVEALPADTNTWGTTIGEIESLITQIGHQHDQLGYPIDGVVIKAASRHVRIMLGQGSHSPRWALAFKYPPDTAFSILRDIEVGVGRTGRASFRAVIDPVQVGGTTITYASLHHAAWITDQGLGLGSRVAVVRAGDVIPRVTAAVGEQPDGVVAWQPPGTCPQCDQPWDTSTQLWRCTTPSCSVVSLLTYAASRDVWDIDGLGEEVATALVESGLVSSIADLFALTASQIATVPYPRRDFAAPVAGVRHIGKPTATKLVAGIAAATSQPLARHITALGIRMTGRRMGRTLAAHFGTLDALRTATLDQLAEVEGVGPEKARSIHEGLRAHTEVLDRLVDAGITRRAESAPAGSAPLAGQTVVITGAVQGMSRAQAQDAAAQLGATVSGSVSAKTDLLVVGSGSSTRSKLVKAQEFGVESMPAEQFVALLERG